MRSDFHPAAEEPIEGSLPIRPSSLGKAQMNLHGSATLIIVQHMLRCVALASPLAYVLQHLASEAKYMN